MNHTALASFTDPSSYTPIDILTLVAAGLALLISVLAYLHQRKELKLSSILEIFKFLSTQEQRELRGTIFDVYQYLYPEGLDKAKQEGKAGKMVFDDNHPIKTYIKIVSSSFDQAGVLVKKKIIDPDLFFEVYAEMVVRVWKVLEEDIMKERERNQEVCKWFLELNKEAVERLQKKGIIIAAPYKRVQVLSNEEIERLIQPRTKDKSRIEQVMEDEKARLAAEQKYKEEKIPTPNPNAGEGAPDENNK